MENSTGRKRVTAFLLIICFFVLGLPSLILADSAEVLPKGAGSVNINSKFFFTVDKRYGPNGDVQDAAHDYNRALDSKVFSSLGLVETAFKMPPGSANIGTSVVTFRYNNTIVESSFSYGITDRLTVGVIIPKWFIKNNVTDYLDTSKATVGKNAALKTLAPLTVPGTVPLTTEDVQNILGKGLDVNGDGKIDVPGFGYKRFESFSNNGIGDMEAGLKYQYLKTESWRLAFTGGMRLPTGQMDDRDNLTDYAIGSGAWAVLLRSQNDFILIKDLVLNATVRYDHPLAFTRTLRLPKSADQPITSTVGEVEKRIGEIVELEGSANYSFAKGWNSSLLYKYGFSQSTKVKKLNGEEVRSLEDQTDYTEQVFFAGISYSTLPLYLEKKFSIPLVASLGYRNRFAGSNKVLKSQYISVGLQVYF